MLNQKSDYLVILIATYNRLSLLKSAIDSILDGTRCPHELIVIDGGSTDGTIEFLESHSGITPVFQGKLFGTSRSYNQVWRQINSRFTCWLSDDTDIVAGSLDLAVGILELEPHIGMVGLKMKDTMGPNQNRPYMGAISEFGILNCNHGVLSTDLLRSVGYFNESYRSYTIDPDLTASVLCTGKRVVMTKAISVLHNREWATHHGMEDKSKEEMGGIDNKKIYQQKFKFLGNPVVPHRLTKVLIKKIGTPFLFPQKGHNWAMNRLGFNYRDWKILTHAKFVHPLDPIHCKYQHYHLIQQIPKNILLSENNPYHKLVE